MLFPWLARVYDRDVATKTEERSVNGVHSRARVMQMVVHYPTDYSDTNSQDRILTVLFGDGGISQYG